MTNSVRLRLVASGGAACHVYFEPESAEVLLSDGDSLHIVVTGNDLLGAIEVTYLPEGVMVWVPDGAETCVFDSAGARVPV